MEVVSWARRRSVAEVSKGRLQRSVEDGSGGPWCSERRFAEVGSGGRWRSVAEVDGGR